MDRGMLAKRESDARQRINQAGERLVALMVQPEKQGEVALPQVVKGKDKDVAAMLNLEAVADLLELLIIEAERLTLPPEPPTKEQVAAIVLGDGGVSGLSGAAENRIRAWAGIVP